MKNCLIILGILFVTFLAVTDTIDKWKEIQNISTATPSQVEMQNQLQKCRKKLQNYCVNSGKKL